MPFLPSFIRNKDLQSIEETAQSVADSSPIIFTGSEPIDDDAEAERLRQVTVNTTSQRRLSSSRSVSPSAQKTAFFKTAAKTVEHCLETSNALVSLIEAVVKVHPYIEIAVLPFKAIIYLRKQQKDNEKKINFVLSQIQDTVYLILELRKLDKKDADKAKSYFEHHMRPLADDIESCGNACELYAKKHPVAKVYWSSEFHNIFADYVVKFGEWQKTLESQWKLLLAKCVYAIDNKIDNLSYEIGAVQKYMDEMKEDLLTAIKQILCRFTPRREKLIEKQIDQQGGWAKIKDNDTAIMDILSFSNEIVPGFSIDRRDATSIGLADLKQELLEDVDESLTKNIAIFNAKLDMQKQDLQDAVDRGTGKVLDAIESHASGARQIENEVLQGIWKDQGWKGNTKARHFVLSLHDHYSAQLKMLTSNLDSDEPIPGDDTNNLEDPESTRNDHWALPFINIMGMRPLLEIIDDDSTGFVSVTEVNEFTAKIPEGWSLPAWLAFWAKGWQCSLWEYRLKICGIVQSMYSLLDEVQPKNRELVERYLSAYSFQWIQLLLKSIRPCTTSDRTLLQKIEAYTAKEERRMEDRMEKLSYDLDAPNTVVLVTGQDRIERHVVPLLYILLKRHLKIIKAACTFKLSLYELADASESLGSILSVVDRRIDNMMAIFKQTHIEPTAPLKNFALGMFQFLPFSDTHLKEIVQDNIFSDDSPSIGDDSLDQWEVSVEVLKYPEETIDSMWTDRYRTRRIYKAICDSCGRTIIDVRLICLQCTSVGLGNQIDLCISCIDETPATDDRGVHLLTHDLVRIKKHLHSRDKVAFFTKTRRAVNAAKRSARGNNTSLNDEAAETRRAVHAKRCDYCSQNLPPSYWLCIKCHTLICDECDVKLENKSNENPDPDENPDSSEHPDSNLHKHKHTHPVIRIRPNRSVSSRLAMLEERMKVIESTLSDMRNFLKPRDPGDHLETIERVEGWY